MENFGPAMFINSGQIIPGWFRQSQAWEVATEPSSLKKLEVEVDMCCPACAEKVQVAVCGMPGVFDYKTDLTNNLLTVTECPDGGPNHKELLKAVKKAIGKKGKIVTREPASAEPNPDNERTTDGERWSYYYPAFVVMPYSANSSSPFITNPNYLHHPTVCCNCFMYPDAACGNCGRGAEH
ncbi:uncharacterized protein [Physcomitrium patens]|uniref:HMA domain-containing protein n=1 Tax=Physcomitrium patens TaxID=3218 RepID=A0A2K1KCJ4_PHYPA|nr:uncharacterized protein LOC112284472 [Physcomitrium patens]PNR51504.1 hypothetical protein PHYPA_010691 [Physcomitrium patens]|eukprot:XP_024380057.1 uncharacterized protein LOC112284472 [Physcomitrella patens]